MEEIAFKYWNLNTTLLLFLILFSSKILIHQVFAFDKICVLEEEGEPEEKSEEEIEIIEGQEESNKSNKSGSEDEVNNSITENKQVSMYDHYPSNIISVRAVIWSVKDFCHISLHFHKSLHIVLKCTHEEDKKILQFI